MDDADTAFKAAEERIEKARAEGATRLDLNAAPFRDLDRLPPAIASFTQLEFLSLKYTQVADLTPLQGLSALERLDLNSTQVADLTPLQGLATLQRLSLTSTRVTDLTPLQGLSALQTLVLFNTQVTDLTPLKGLSALGGLHLAKTQVTDLAALKDLSALETLDLNAAKVTDLAPLRCLYALKTLGLAKTLVTDLAPLEGISALQRLVIDNTRVADLAPLRGLSALETFDLGTTQVTDLRPIADLPELGKGKIGRLRFKDTPAARATPELTRLSEIEDDKQRTRETLAYLRTLPPWPAPLPWEETQPAASSRPETATAGPAGQTPEGPAPPPHGLPRLITARRARQVLETHATELRGQCQFVTDQINQTLAQHIPAKPNDPEELAEWTHLFNTLQLSRAAIVSLHEAIPDRAEERPVTEDETNRLKHAFETAIATLQQASAYIDGPAEAHGRTYAGLLKIGVCSALAAPIALISAQPVALIGGGLYAMLYGKGAALDVVKAIGASTRNSQ